MSNVSHRQIDAAKRRVPLPAKSLAALLVTTALLMPCAATAQTVAPPVNGQWYYQIGGGDPMLYWTQSNKTNLELGAGAQWQLFRGCSFDPQLSIFDTFTNIEDSLYGIANDLLGSATTVFAGFALSKLQESYPSMYDLVSKGLKDAKESYQVSVKSCRDITRDIAAGNNPADGWFSVSRKSDWQRAAADGENPVRAEREIEESAGENGVEFAGGVKKGGRNEDGTEQDPISIVWEMTSAGFAHLVGEVFGASETAAGSPMVTGDPSIARVFESAEDASEWVISVLGDREIMLCADCERVTTRVGQGLRFQVVQEKEVVQSNLNAVLSQQQLPSAAQLDALSVPGMSVTIGPHLIRQLKASTVSERAILGNRLVAELALAKVMEKALIARDLMLAGRQDPNLTAAGEVAQREGAFVLGRLQEEIDAVLFETQVRKQVLVNAAGTISALGEARDRAAEGMDLERGTNPQRGMIDGAIPEPN